MNTQNIYNNKDINTKINLDTNSSTKIKICGLTSPAEARYLNENHVDFAGMVLFFPKSKRNISIEQAKDIMVALDASIKRVAVVVSPSIEQIRQIEAAGFDYVQIHGEIPETEAEAAKAIPILKAFNVSDMDSYEKYHASQAMCLMPSNPAVEKPLTGSWLTISPAMKSCCCSQVA